jgi:hypothetical protein
MKKAILSFDDGFETDYTNTYQILKKNKARGTSKFVIMAAGIGSRWKNYLGVPKQLVKIDDESILHRTIRLLRENGIDNIVVTVPKKGYFGDLGVVEIEGSSEYEMDRFLNAKNGSEATFLYGDVYYTEELIKDIVKSYRRNATLKASSPRFWGRTDTRQGIGRGIPEIFAIRFNSELWEIAKKLRKTCSTAGSGWNVYFYLTQKRVPTEPQERRDIIRLTTNENPLFEPVLDITDDFDKADDYDVWMANYKKLSPVNPQKPQEPQEPNESKEFEKEKLQRIIENYKLKNPLKYKQKEQELMDRLAQLS